MKILLCHNYYQRLGGEDQSFADEARLLTDHGHEVSQFTLHNDSIEQVGFWNVSRRALWNGPVYRELRQLMRRSRPDVMHCTNTFPLISPSALYAARDEDIPVVQALRNYRMLCINGLLLRNGKVCHDCIGRATAWPGTLHGCYRESRPGSLVVAAMLSFHRLLNTWKRAVDLLFTPSEFARQKFIQSGWPGDRIAVKPNFVHPDPGPSAGSGKYVAFVGRLAPEKGIHTLLKAWRMLRQDVTLKIMGDGPLAARVQQEANDDPRIEYLGHRTRDEVLEIVGNAACVVVPSLWYETFGRVIMESFAKGTPVIASGHGAMAELVQHGETGLLFKPGDPVDLAAKIRDLLDSKIRLHECRVRARQEFEQKYTAPSNYELLMSIYQQATENCAARRHGVATELPRLLDVK